MENNKIRENTERVGAKSVAEWIHTYYLYEHNLFIYSLINFLWYLIGISVLGFQLNDFTPLENLFFNFLWCLFLWIIFCFPEVWYHLFLGKNAYLLRIKRYFQQHKNQSTINNLANKGQRLLNVREKLALGFLFMILLFDAFYAGVWVKDGILIWQPEWVMACIDWVRSHLTTPEVHGYWNWYKWDIFHIAFGDTEIDSALKQEFGDEYQFLQNPISHTLLFYHFVRTILFIPIITAICIVLWQPFQFMGNKDPSQIRSIMDFIRASAWSIVMAFFGILPTYFLVNKITIFYNFIHTGGNFKFIFIMYFFIALSVRFFVGWLIFWQRLLMKFFRSNLS